MKALKILVHDLRSGGESAAIRGHGDNFDLESDDGVGRPIVFVTIFSHSHTGRGMD